MFSEGLDEWPTRDGERRGESVIMRMRSLPFILALFVVVMALGTSLAGTISIAWDPVTDPDLAGYKVYYGTAPGVYTHNEDVGNRTSTTLVGLDACTHYYIAIKAYDSSGAESASYSNQIDGLPRPVVTASSPSGGEQGASTTLSVTGESFVDGARVEFSGTGITVQSTTWVACGELSVAIQISGSAATGARNITVINPDRTFGTGTGLFTVIANASPSVTSSDPAAGATDVPVTVHPRVIFNERMAAATITANNVRLLDATGAPVAQAAGSPALSADALTVTITPNVDLAHRATYRIWVRGGASGVTDVSGKAMAANWEQSPGFTTAATGDTQGPRVSATDPADGATGVSAAVHPVVTFNEPLDPASVSSSTVRLLDASDQPVAQQAASPQLSADGRRVTITLAAPLGENAVYRIQVLAGSSGVKDVAGNPMDTTYLQGSGFTIENLPPSTVQNTHRTDVR